MIPSRSRLAQWNFDGLSNQARDVQLRGDAIEESGTRIDARCRNLPDLRAWTGPAQSAAEGAFGRAKVKSVVVGDMATDLSNALESSFWELWSAKKKLTGMAAEIEAGSFLIHDKWVVTLRPGPMTRTESARLLSKRAELQGLLNPLVGAVGDADESSAQAIAAAAQKRGYEPAKASVQDILRNALSGVPKPVDDAPDPRIPLGVLMQQSIADADAALTVASKSYALNADGDPVTTVVMQDGSSKVLTQRTTVYGERHLEQQEFDPSGKLVSTTFMQPWGDDGTRTMIRYADGSYVTIIDHADDTRTGSVSLPNGQQRELDSEFFSHPALTVVGGLIAETQSHADKTLKNSLTTLTKNSFENVHAGAKMGGTALAVGVALYDVATADSGQERCQASIAGVASVVGGLAGGAVGAAVPVGGIGLAGFGATVGSWTFGWLGSEIGEVVCSR